MMARFVVVVGVSFDAAGEQAWQYALRLCAHRSAALHLCHVVDPSTLHSLSADTHALLDDRAEQLQVFALEKATEFVRQTGAQVRLHVCIGPIAERLADYAVENCADAIAVGDHTAPGTAQLLPGKVASRLVRIAPCTVLVARVPHYGESSVAGEVESDPFRSDDDEFDDARRSFPFGLPGGGRTPV